MGHRFHKTPLTINLTEVWGGFTGLGCFNGLVESTPEYEVNSLYMAAPVAEWLRSLIISTLNRSSSLRCGFEHSSVHMWDKPGSVCRWSGIFSRGSLVFAPPFD